MKRPPEFVGNAGTDFTVGGAPARFIFSTEEGKILAWNSSLGTQAQVVADRGLGAIYKGLAIAGGRLYATDFHNGRVDVFDSSFDYVPLPGGFVDPGQQAGSRPSESRRSAATSSSPTRTGRRSGGRCHHQGLGFVDEYDTNGVLALARIATRGQLNAPWGLALAPGDFGRFSGDLLVGNFGDGRDQRVRRAAATGHYKRVGELRGANDKPIPDRRPVGASVRSWRREQRTDQHALLHRRA